MIKKLLILTVFLALLCVNVWGGSLKVYVDACDVYWSRNDVAAYLTVRNNATAELNDIDGAYARVGQWFEGINEYYVRRYGSMVTLAHPDTVPQVNTLDSVAVYIYNDGQYGNTDEYCVVMGLFDCPFVVGEWDEWRGGMGSYHAKIPRGTQGTYWRWSITADSCLALWNKSGDTYFGVRSEDDVSATAPPDADAGVQFRTRNYGGSSYEPYVVFYHSAPPANQAPTAATGLKCEGVVNPDTVWDCTMEFKATFQDPDADDLADWCMIAIDTTMYDTTNFWYKSDSISITPCTEGAECAEVSYPGDSTFLHRTKYYWNIKYRDDGGLWGPWSAETTSYFKIDFDPDYDYCHEIKLGTDHGAIAQGYILTLEKVLGYGYRVASNGFKDEAIQHNSHEAMALLTDTNGTRLNYVYVAENEGCSTPLGCDDANYTAIWAGYYDVGGKTYSTPTRVCSLHNIPNYDTHWFPNLGADSSNYLYCVWGGHGRDSIWYKKSTLPNDVTSWEATVSIPCANATYPMFEASPSGDTLIIAYRSVVDGGDTDYQYCWARSNDGGSNWDLDTIIYAWAVEAGESDSLTRLYAYAFDIDANSVVHWAFSWLTNKPIEYGGVESRGVWYAKCALDDSVWYQSDGLTVAGTTWHQYICPDSAEIIIASDTATASYKEYFPDRLVCPTNTTAGWVYISGIRRDSRSADNMDTTAAHLWWHNTTEWQSCDLSDSVNRYMSYGRAGLAIAMTPGRGDTIKIFTLVYPYPDSVSQLDSSEWFAAEVGEFVSYDTGRADWTFNLITDKSEKGHGMLGSYQDPNPNDNVYLIYGSLRDVIITQDDVYVEGLRNGDDWRVVWNCTEKDRRANRWGFYQGEVYFRNPWAVAANLDDWPTDQGHLFLYHGKMDAANPEDNPDQIWFAGAGLDAFWESFNYTPEATLWSAAGFWEPDGDSNDIIIKSLPDVHSFRILQGDKACYFDSCNAETYAATIIGANLSDYVVTGWINILIVYNPQLGDRNAWIGIKNNDSLFKAGIFMTYDGDYRFGYHDGTSWTITDSTTRIPIRDSYYKVGLVVSGDAVDVYFNDSLYYENVTAGLGAIDSLAIGTTSQVKAFFDNLIVQPWMANPPELHLEPIGTGYSGKFPRGVVRGVMR